jgi:osmotically-inducible protein OsmY
MRKHINSLALVAVLGVNSNLARSVPHEPPQNPSGAPSQQAPAPDQAKSSAAALKTQSDIQNALAKDYSLPTSNVNVQVNDQGVQLTGTVPTKDAKDKVEQIATAHCGGLPVKNDIKVVASSPK